MMMMMIYTNLLSASIHCYQEKRKKTPGSKNNNISNYRPGDKEKSHRTKKKKKKKRKGQLRYTSWKKSRDMQSVGQKKKKTHSKMLQCYNYRECSIQSRANYKK